MYQNESDTNVKKQIVHALFIQNNGRALVEIARRCMLDRDVFASEFVIRAHREHKKVVEIPFAVREKRPPSINLIKRVPHVLKSVARLAISIRQNET